MCTKEQLHTLARSFVLLGLALAMPVRLGYKKPPQHTQFRRPKLSFLLRGKARASSWVTSVWNMALGN